MNYLDILVRYYPGVQVECFGDPSVYADIVWVDGPPLPSEEDLDQKLISALKEERIAALSDRCQVAIVGGFLSDALGTIHIYDSEDVDQINLIGALLSTTPTEVDPSGSQIDYATRPIVDGVAQPKVYVSHTFAQLRQVIDAGAQFKLANLQMFNTKRDYINYNCTTAEEIAAVTWESNP